MVRALSATLLNGSPAQAAPTVTKAPVAVGRNGAASTVDLDATRVAIDVLRAATLSMRRSQLQPRWG
jgi:hypothetical protein